MSMYLLYIFKAFLNNLENSLAFIGLCLFLPKWFSFAPEKRPQVRGKSLRFMEVCRLVGSRTGHLVLLQGSQGDSKIV